MYQIVIKKKKNVEWHKNKKTLTVSCTFFVSTIKLILSFLSYNHLPGIVKLFTAYISITFIKYKNVKKKLQRELRRYIKFYSAYKDENKNIK